MKKTFPLTHEKIKYPRMIESVRAEARKYIKRSRRKELPKGVDFWDFGCRFGASANEAKDIHLAEIDKFISEAEKLELPSLYLEILPKHGHRLKKEKASSQS
jgi:hypothetical protein